MANTMTLTAPQIVGLPIINGQRVLSTQYPLSLSALTHTSIAVSTTDLITVALLKFGTLTGDCSLRLEASVDGGTNFRQVKEYSNAQIADAEGLIDTIQLKATHVRAYLIPGTMTGANGVNFRVLV